MSSASRHLPACAAMLLPALLATAVASAADAGAAPGGAALRVCADPNNLPYSNARGEGFENEIARMAARDLHRPLDYTWLPQRRGFVRHTLAARTCDVIIGVPTRLDRVQTTRPYYRSSYVFVTRRDRGLHLQGFGDPRLGALRIGVHAIGDDYANVPPALALARHGLQAQLQGYSIYGDYSRPEPARGLIDAVARGDIDVAIAWGPFAAFAREEPVALDVRPVDDSGDPALAMRYDVSMGVRKDDAGLRGALDAFIARRQADIAAVLARHGVPVVAGGPDNDGRR